MFSSIIMFSQNLSSLSIHRNSLSLVYATAIASDPNIFDKVSVFIFHQFDTIVI